MPSGTLPALLSLAKRTAERVGQPPPPQAVLAKDSRLRDKLVMGEIGDEDEEIVGKDQAKSRRGMAGRFEKAAQLRDRVKSLKVGV